MSSARQILISTFGALVGLIGIEHGVGEILQGNVSPSGRMILSWPNSAFFAVLNGEPAMTLVPNLLATGLLACLVSLIYILWAVRFVQRRHAGLVLMLLSVGMLLVGGGIFPPAFGLLIGLAATRLYLKRENRIPARRPVLAALWPASLGAALLAWLSMVPGLPAMSYFFGVENVAFIFALLVGMLGLLFLAGAAAWAYDIRPRP